MLKIRVMLVKVDYDQIAERFIPDAVEGSLESKHLSMRLAGKLLVKDGETSTLAKSVLRLIPQQAKDSFAYHLVLRNQNKIRESMNQYLMKEFRGLFIENLRLLDTEKAVYDVIKLEVTLNEIDYNQVLSQLAMKMIDNLSQKPEKSGRLAQVFLALGDAPGEMVAAALSVLSQEAKDQLLVDLFKVYQEEVVESVNQALEQQGLSAQIEKLKVIKE
ncbi:MAG: hypothetical protein K0R34_1389 [Herbinix sp.]|jgi:hypothetical protein|nr:hypothetical protein [Herbinix sp.]